MKKRYDGSKEYKQMPDQISQQGHRNVKSQRDTAL